jgi:hypothetical protein
MNTRPLSLLFILVWSVGLFARTGAPACFENNPAACPDPVINGPEGPFCPFSNDATFTGTAGKVSGTGRFFLNGAPIPTAETPAGSGNWTTTLRFNTLGAGPYELVFEFDTGNPPPPEQACIVSVKRIIEVQATPATLSCSDLVQVSLDQDCSVKIRPEMVLQGNYGCYDDYKVTLNFNGNDLGNVLNGAYAKKTVNVKVAHLVSGNQCWGKILVEDKIKPYLKIKDVTLTCADTAYSPEFIEKKFGYGYGLLVASDNCTPPNELDIKWFDTWGDLDCNSQNELARDYSAYILRKWQAADACGNVETLEQRIYFKRFTLKNVFFPADKNLDCNKAADADNLSVTGTPAIWDNLWKRWVPLQPTPNAASACDFSVVYEDQTIRVCDGTRKIVRTWTVIDWCANSQKYDGDTGWNEDGEHLFANSTRRYDVLKHLQIIKVADETGPVFPDVPDPVEVAAGPYKCEICNPDLPSIVLNDRCARIVSANARVTAYAVDQYGERIQIGSFQTTADLKPTGDPADPWSRDTLADFRPFNTCFPAGEHEVVFTAKDHCGNTSTLYRKLTVLDKTPPQPVCHELTQVAVGADGTIRVPADRFDNGSYDNCKPLYFKAKRMSSVAECLTNGTKKADGSLDKADRFDDFVKFCCTDLNAGEIPVILRIYTDPPRAGAVDDDEFIAPGNYNECMVRVLVEDKLPPSCTAPKDLSVWCDEFDPSLWTYGQATASDNCEIPTLGETINKTKFDSLCKRGTIVRTWTAKDKSGRTTRCTQQVFVNYRESYTICFPADIVTTTCDKGAYTEPTFTGEDCELLAKSYKDDTFFVVEGACYKVERSWRVINWCTYDANAGYVDVMETPNGARLEINRNESNRVEEFAGCAGAAKIMEWTYDVGGDRDAKDPRDVYASGYEYKQIIKVLDNVKPVLSYAAPDACDESGNNPLLWKGMWSVAPNAAAADLCEGKKELCATGIDACSDALRFSYQLFLDIDGDGVMETVINSNNPPAAGTVDGKRFFDNRPFGAGETIKTQNDLYRWTLTMTGSDKACVTWTDKSGAVPAEFPYGKHKIKWFLEDRCGNTTTNPASTEVFEIKDCKKPVVVCKNLNANIMKVGDNGTVALWASDFYDYGEDNCTPAKDLKFAVTRENAAPPADFSAAQSIVLDCADVKAGTTVLWVWVKDGAGNVDFCASYTKVQDNLANACTNNLGGKVTVAGVLLTEKSQGIADGNVNLEGSHPALPPLSLFSTTNETGAYRFSNIVPLAGNYTVTPIKDDNPLNGVTTFDLVLISRHILGLEPLNTPYKMIAADANRSNSISASDIVEFRKLILGVFTELPNNTSWRFIDKSYVFPNPANPFSTPFPENKTVVQVSANRLADDFIGTKIGDVNESASTGNAVSTEDRSTGTLYLDADDRAVQPGEVFEVNMTAAERMQGCQFTMLYDIAPGEGMGLDNFGVFQPASVLTGSFDGISNTTNAVFTLKFRAKRAGHLSQLLKISNRITRAEAYNAEGVRSELALRFKSTAGTTISGVGFELYQNQPNPFADKTFIGFYLPDAMEATLTVYDETGRLLHRQKGAFPKGDNRFRLDRLLVPAFGLLYYKVETETGSATKKMMSAPAK